MAVRAFLSLQTAANDDFHPQKNPAGFYLTNSLKRSFRMKIVASTNLNKPDNECVLVVIAAKAAVVTLLTLSPQPA